MIIIVNRFLQMTNMSNSSFSTEQSTQCQRWSVFSEPFLCTCRDVDETFDISKPTFSLIVDPSNSQQ